MTEETPDMEFESQEEEDAFIRGVMTAQVWGRVLREDPADLAQELKDDDGKLGEEYTARIYGEENEFEKAIADEYGIPYQMADGSMKLAEPYGPRYNKAWKELGVTASDNERKLAALSTAFLHSIGPNDQDVHKQ